MNCKQPKTSTIYFFDISLAHMKGALLVFVGGGLGSVGRYLLGLAFNNSKSFLPYGTLAANILGSFLIGLLMAYFIQNNTDTNYKLLAIAGFCGGFTTMSSFSAESISFLQSGRYSHFFIYLFVTLIVCLVATMLGLRLFRP